MPKSSKILNDFSGGLNKRKDPKDLEDNEFPESFGISNSIEGKLISLGGLNGQGFKPSTNTAVTSITTDTDTMAQGYGMLSYNSDDPITKSGNLIEKFQISGLENGNLFFKWNAKYQPTGMYIIKLNFGVE